MKKPQTKGQMPNSNKNSSFDKLLKLQSTLQEEVALRDIFFEDRDSLLKKIENNCIEDYKMRISIQEIYDNKLEHDSSGKKIKYIFCEKPQSEIPQYYDHLSSIMYYFHENREMLLKLIENSPKDYYPNIANFLCNYFYVNIFSSTFLNENLLILIYLFLEKEIDQLSLKENTDDILSKPFLDINNSFTPYLLRCLTRKDEIKTYLESILKKVLTRTAGFLNNQRNNLFLGFDIKKMLAFLNGQNYPIKNSNKTFKSYLNLLTMEIKKSKLNLIRKRNKENEEYAYSYSTSYSKSGFENYENNFYAITTKETFDNLLLGNNENINTDDIDDDSSEGDEELSQKKKEYIKKSMNHENRSDDFEYFLINSGFYYKINDTREEKKRESGKYDTYNDLYTKELNKETFL